MPCVLSTGMDDTGGGLVALSVTDDVCSGSGSDTHIHKQYSKQIPTLPDTQAQMLCCLSLFVSQSHTHTHTHTDTHTHTHTHTTRLLPDWFSIDAVCLEEDPITSPTYCCCLHNQ